MQFKVLLLAIAIFGFVLVSGCIEPPAVCGNGICETDEDIEGTASYCPTDCPR